MDYKTIMDDPILASMVVAVLGAVGLGLKKVWDALVEAVVRALDQVAPDHTGNEQELVAKVRQFSGHGKVASLMTTVAPESTIKKKINEWPEDGA
jgi:hypothetical protein